MTRSPLALIAAAGLHTTLKHWIKVYKLDRADVLAALTEAVRTESLEMTKDLLDKLTFSDMTEAEPVLLLASGHGNEKICCLLVAAIAASVSDPQWHPRLILRASWLGLDKFVRLLVQNGASVEVKVRDMTPLHYVACNNHTNLARFLIETQPNLVNMTMNTPVTVLHLAGEHGHAEMTDILMEAGPRLDLEYKVQLMRTACLDGKHAVVRVLLERGVEAEDECKEYEFLPLPGAANYGFTKCVAAILDKERVNIDHGSPGGTALSIAVRNGHLETMRLLLDRGADPDSKNNTQPVIVTAAAKLSNLDATRLLMESGRSSIERRTHALRAAAWERTSVAIVRLLLRNGADPNGQLPSPVLHAAVHGKNTDILQELISKGARLDTVGSEGQSTLHIACDNISMVQALLEAGEDVNYAMKSNDATPLHYAADLNRTDVLKAILEKEPEL